MGIPYAIVIVIFVALYISNGVLCSQYKNLVGEDEWHTKMASNSLGVFYCLLGVAGVAIAEYWIEWLKYGILILFGIFALWGILQLVITLTTSLAAKSNGPEVLYCGLSNTIVAFCDILIVIIVIKYML